MDRYVHAIRTTEGPTAVMWCGWKSPVADNAWAGMGQSYALTRRVPACLYCTDAVAFAHGEDDDIYSVLFG